MILSGNTNALDPIDSDPRSGRRTCQEQSARLPPD
jgi:hypothetical protein